MYDCPVIVCPSKFRNMSSLWQKLWAMFIGNNGMKKILPFQWFPWTDVHLLQCHL